MYELNAVLNIISSLPSTLTLAEILADFSEKMTQLVEVVGCTVFRFQRESDTLVVLANYVSPQITTPFGEVNHVGAVYSLDHYPAMAQVLRQQSPLTIHVDELTVDEPERDLLDAFQWGGMLLVPMLCKGQTIGLLNLHVDDKHHHQFSEDSLLLCQVLANQAAIAIENAWLYQEVDEGQLIAEAMQVIGRALASELDYQRIVRNVADFVYRLVNAQFVYVAVPEDEDFRLVAMAGHDNIDAPNIFPFDVSSGLKRSPLIQAVQEERPVVVSDIQDDVTPMAPEDTDAWRWRSIVAVPLLAHSKLMGVLAAYSSQPNFFSANDVAMLMSLASQAAVAIQNAQLFAELEAQREALQQVSLRLVNAQEEERRRISRELHDELGQALTALKINLDVARRSLPSEASAKFIHSVDEASSLAVQTLETARNLSLELHPAILDDLGLVSALRWEIDRFEQRTGQAVHFKADLVDAVLRSELEITIYRIITEALTNVTRHAQAKRISVQLQAQNHQIIINVEDDGVGFDAKGWFNSPGERRSLGLVGMHERAGLLGGELEIISELGSGTKISVQLPLNN